MAGLCLKITLCMHLQMRPSDSMCQGCSVVGAKRLPRNYNVGELQKAGKSSTSTRQPRTLQQQRRLLYDLLREHDSAAYSPRLCQVGKSSGRRSIWPTRKTEENVNQIEGKRPGKALQRTKPGRHCKGQNRKPKRRTRPGNELRQQKKKENQETEKLQQS